jgi:hypothetical protein
MIMPGVLDRFLATKGYEGQLTREPTLSGETDNLYHPLVGRHSAHGRFDDRARSKAAVFNPALLRSAITLAVTALILALIFSFSSGGT